MGFTTSDDGPEAREKAIKAVKDGVESERQREIVVAASKQSGGIGQNARDALQGR